MSRPRVRATALLGALVMSLSACSVAGTDFQPGVAARVGDTTFTDREVDRTATLVCDAFGDAFEQQNQVVPISFLKRSVLISLSIGSAARQLAADYDIVPGPAYRRDVAAAADEAGAGVSDEAREALVVVNTTQTLLVDLLGQVGAEVASRTADPDAPDVDGATPDAESQEAVDIGQQALEAWLADNDTEVSPAFDLDLAAAGGQYADSSVAFAASDAARTGDAAAGAGFEDLVTPDAMAATMQLPPTQRCGRFQG